MTARLTVLLGAGGVGKTTLAAAYAIALARSGRRVGLLGINPSFRLMSALGVELSDREAPIPGEPGLVAAVLSPRESLARWVAEAYPEERDRARLARNPFFVALAGRLASATDIFAAVRLAEWVERDETLDNLVIDTAPGLNAIEFLRRPERLAAFLETRVATFLRHIPRALARVGGVSLFSELAEFFTLIEPPLDRLVARLGVAQRWMGSGAMELLLVTAVRDDAARVARDIAAALAERNLSPRAVIVDRALPDALLRELPRFAGEVPEEATAFLRYARAYAAMQSRIVEAASPLAPRLVTVPAVRGLDETERRGALAGLGEHLRAFLHS